MRSLQHLLTGAGALALAAVALAGGAAQAGKFKVLHSFCSGNDGCLPQSRLVMDQSGNFFGTTEQGG
jgi:hypothetical protein